jgi:Na+/H+ antiporter NhaC
LLNCGIIYEATRYARAQQNESNLVVPSPRTKDTGAAKKAEMTRTIILITFLYILLTLPGAIIAGYFYNTLIVSDIGSIFIILSSNIQFIYQAFNFFILYFTNKLFAKEVRRLFGCGRRQFRSNRVSQLRITMTATRKLSNTQKTAN